MPTLIPIKFLPRDEQQRHRYYDRDTQQPRGSACANISQIETDLYVCMSCIRNDSKKSIDFFRKNTFTEKGEPRVAARVYLYRHYKTILPTTWENLAYYILGLLCCVSTWTITLLQPAISWLDILLCYIHAKKTTFSEASL